MKILDQNQIKQKIKRLAIEIYENNYSEKSLILAGINNSGMAFAKLLQIELESSASFKVILTQIRLNPANPLDSEITVGLPLKELNGKVVIVVDDVANTGRTVFYATKPLLEIVPKKVEVVVLVDRKHKSFPIQADYVGMSLSTTLQESIDVDISSKKDWSVHLI